MIIKLLINGLVGFLFASANAEVMTVTHIIANDSSGKQQNLFNEFDSGKGVILNWVMPPTQLSYIVSQSYNTSHHGNVLYNLIDDYRGEFCHAYKSGFIEQHLGNKMKIFSRSSIHCSNFVVCNMPKIAVAGNNHRIYYNNIGANDTALSDLQAPINTAVDLTSLNHLEQELFSFNIATSGTLVTFDFSLKFTSKNNLHVYNSHGTFVC